MPTFLRRLFRTFLRMLAVLAGAVFAVSLFAAGTIAVLGLVAWSMLRGRKPVTLRWGAFQARRVRPARGGGEVVDVVAREVRGPEQRLMRD